MHSVTEDLLVIVEKFRASVKRKDPDVHVRFRIALVVIVSATVYLLAKAGIL